MRKPNDILVVGGSGVVGRRVAALLAPDFPDRVVIAVRDALRAEVLCKELGHGVRARRIDVNDIESIGPALDGVGTVMKCVAQHELHLLRSAISRGLAYTDIAPHLALWDLAESMSDEARNTGACVVLGAGLSPGISNMMARQLANELGHVSRIETAILLSLGDEYGPDSLRHVLEALTHPFQVLDEGHRHNALPLSAGQEVEFPEPLCRRTAYLFPWSDVVCYPKTFGARTALGRFALDPPWAGRLAAMLVRAGARRWLARPGVRSGNRRAVERLKRLYRGQDRFGLVVTAEGDGRVMMMSLGGRHQADVTAAAASQFARALALGEVDKAGVFLPEEVVPHEPFFQALAEQGWIATVKEASALGSRTRAILARQYDNRDPARRRDRA